MDQVTLKDITSKNWRECIRLKVRDDQTGFVASNAVSLAQAAYQADGLDWQPRGIYAGEEMVGFIMYGIEMYQDKPVWDIIRLMIDQKHQRKGYAGAAIRAVLDVMRASDSGATDVYISFVPENIAARTLYARLGFNDAGMTPNGEEVLMHLRL